MKIPSKKLEMPKSEMPERDENFDVMSEEEMPTDEEMPTEDGEETDTMKDYSDDELLAAVDEAHKRGLIEASDADEEAEPAMEAMSEDKTDEEKESDPEMVTGSY